ncbi:hypothetical protein M2401_005840 [Pseudomonas sp. JUb42]|jgi:hypothetical protein|uniref:DUF6124 family protein n=1 Tax=Pseudomonas sp. JUb42 TaxID=2940611 RepID=UPI002167FAC3|nr:hypothetical protein [Pseudomonas sp. JUb42]MCS3472076.1 hypothetical protein [Pseudomonas sp. JUb42]
MNTPIPNLFILNPDIPTEELLIFASEYLDSTAAIVYETADNISSEYRPLARAAVQQMHVLRTMFDAVAVRVQGQQ